MTEELTSSLEILLWRMSLLWFKISTPGKEVLHTVPTIEQGQQSRNVLGKRIQKNFPNCHGSPCSIHFITEPLASELLFVTVKTTVHNAFGYLMPWCCWSRSHIWSRVRGYDLRASGLSLKDPRSCWAQFRSGHMGNACCAAAAKTGWDQSDASPSVCCNAWGQSPIAERNKPRCIQYCL